MNSMLPVSMSTHQDLLTATDPEKHVAVSASAGTGKTYLLITRILRLLLSGATPGSILALTFTRKAAGEMRERLQNRLWELSTLGEAELNNVLPSIGVTTSVENRQLARRLYETVLFATYPIRITTFHAFCQNLLNRFPLEANIPPGFELLDTHSILQDQAWDALFMEATQDPDSQLSHALETLFESCNNLYNTREALVKGFLSHRSDWWAFTEGAPDPVSFAISELASLISGIPDKPITVFLNQNREALQKFQILLQQHPTQQNLQFSQQLQTGLNQENDKEGFELIKPVFLTAKSETRKRDANKTVIAKMGLEHAKQFIELHEALSANILQTLNDVLSLHTYSLNTGWYLAGQRLLDHYQRIKREQRLLDFADLEWKAYTLLRDPDNALWVQYKLDQKISHLLIDEFQDTNPTQWQLLLPLLEEIASGTQERKRSIFLVGDTKQSIYSFRRAKPELQITATEWLQNHLAANVIPLSSSWRSSPAIIDGINQIFDQTTLGAQLGDFPKHSTHRQELWGHVEILRLVKPESETPPPHREGLRNPLLEPKSQTKPSLHYREGCIIAEKIHTLISKNYGVISSSNLQKLNYSHIFILFRNRTHIAEYERALSDAGIPYIGTQRGGLLDRPEVMDLEALLHFLTTPFNNLALAHILRSPLFAASDDELIKLATETSSSDWFKRLQKCVEMDQASETLTRAWHLLVQWREEMTHLPLHDLLDRIYQKGDVLARYHACSPPNQQMRVITNLNCFIGMALEVDSGRYPSITHFLARLKKLRSADENQPDMPVTQDEQQNRIRLMTIHAAKGLEAPVVFLADGCATTQNRSAYQAIVDWPADCPKPKHFLLSPAVDVQTDFFRHLHKKLDKVQQKEEANLLYVALSRAQHMLFISGCSKHEQQARLGWYGQVRQVLKDKTDDDTVLIRYGEPLLLQHSDTTTACKRAPTLDEKLFIPFQKDDSDARFISPSQTALHPPSVYSRHNEENATEAQLRGLLIHDYLDQLTKNGIHAAEHLYSSYEQDATSTLITDCRQEAIAVVQHPTLDFIFSEKHYDKAYNETSIAYIRDGQIISGIIDRLVISGDTAWVIDYKTHRTPNAATAYNDALLYFPQLALYAEGIRKLDKVKNVKAGIVFTTGPWFRAISLEATILNS